MKKLRVIWWNLGVGLLSYLFLCAGINSVISPFFIALAFACFYIEDNFLNYIFGLILSRLIYDFSWASVFITLNFAAVIIVIKLFQKRTKGILKMGAVFLIMLLGSVVEVVYSLNGVESFILAIINKLLEFAFLYAYMVLFRAIKRRGTNTRLALDELLGLALIIAPIALASSKILIYELTLSQFLVPLGILLVSYLFGGVEAVVVAVIAGVGAAFKNLELTMIAVWVFYAASATGVKRLGRIPMAVSLILLDLIVGFYFGVYENYSWLHLVPIFVAGLVFVLIPKKLICKIKLFIYDKYEEVCLSEIIVQKERHLKDKLKCVSSLFLQMHYIYKNMIIGKLDATQVEEVIIRDIVSQNCKNCPKYKSCYEGKGLAYRAIGELVKKGVSKKRVSLVDTPTILASVCGKTNQIIFQLNTRLEEYKNYEEDLTQEDESKLLMSTQLLGVSEILTEFNSNFSFGKRANEDTEKALIESFLYADIIIKECAIFYTEKGFNQTVLVVKNARYTKADFLDVSSKFFGVKTRIADIRYTKISGWQIVTLEPDSKYVYTLGVAKKSKHQKSGDTYSELKIDENRAMFAISDGKGCGENAEKISEMTINLIEDFYKAGFSSEHIMNNVNKVMSYKSGENFSAVDVVVVDLDLGRADFVKRGGTPSVIKKGNRVQVIEGNDLPIGVLENSRSSLTHYYLDSGDTIVLASDGVFDAFNTSDNFSGYVNNLPAINMQEFASNILNESIRLNNGRVSDDMTVLAVKILLNR